MNLRALSSTACFALSLAGVLAACSAASNDSGSDSNGTGANNGVDGSLDGVDSSLDGNDGSLDGVDGSGTGGGTSGGCGSTLAVLFRDFKGYGEGGHTDFEISAKNIVQTDGAIYKGWNDVGCGLVLSDLGTDGKPVFNATPATAAGMAMVGIGSQKRIVSGPGCWTEANPTPTGVCGIGTCVAWNTPPDFAPPAPIIQSTTSFSDWYTTKEGVNVEVPIDLTLAETAPDSGIFVYDSNAFFPIDGLGFGNTTGQAHNFHFTTEIHVKFEYAAGQKFTFRGDDDLWIFVNGKLALDVGGSHQALEGTIDFDAQAADLGITPGTSYNMDIFHAERQTAESNFRIETNIKCFTPVVR